MTNGLVQHITVEESTSLQWVKTDFYAYCLSFIFDTGPNTKRMKTEDESKNQGQVV